MTTFQEMGLVTELLDAIEKAGYKQPTPIQVQAIPPGLEGRDIPAHVSPKPRVLDLNDIGSKVR